MSQTPPSTDDLRTEIQGHLTAQLGQGVQFLARTFLRVLSAALAGVLVLLYRYNGWVARQMFVSTCDFRDVSLGGVVVNPLVFWGRIFGVGDPVAGVAAEHTITITVENQVGSLAANQRLVGPQGVTYLTLSSVLLDAATKPVTVRAVADPQGGGGIGVIGNLAVSDVLSFESPVDNVARDAVVAATTVTGAEAESEASYRQRVVNEAARRPQGGAAADYRKWARTVAGIVNVYVYTGSAPGGVQVYVEATEASSGSADGIPTSAQLTAVRDAIDLDQDGLASRRPVGAPVTVSAITRLAYDFVISGLSVGDPATVQADISAALSTYLQGREPFIPGLSNGASKDLITNHAVIAIVQEIVAAAGGTFTSVGVTRGGGAVTSETLGRGQRAKLGTVGYS